VRAALEILFD
jgi:acylphosphatase